MKDKRLLFAVLIDADNTSHTHAPAIFNEIARFGEASVRRCYGDFSSPQMAGWNNVQADLGIVPHHSPANIAGKNASDIALVIDAMDLLHARHVDGFVLVSSDSDFTRLASRIREQGLDVYGIGRKNTPDAFRKACKRFIFIENLGDDTPEQPAPQADVTTRDARQKILRAMDAIDPDREWYHLGEIGQYLRTSDPDFDVKSYGKTKLSDLIASMKNFELRKGPGSQMHMRRRG